MKKRKIAKARVYFIFNQIIMFLILLSFIIFFFLTNDDSQKSRLLFNALQALLFIVITIIPRTINKKTKYTVPEFMIIIFDLFCTCHFVLGEIAQFYVYIKYWDAILHMLSGFMLGILGFSFVQIISNNESNKLNPKFCVFFAICFGLSIGMLWEIIEFIIDNIFMTNMQRYINDSTGELLIGQKALNDTMKDLILDTIGVTVSTCIGGISIKLKGVAYEKWKLSKNNQYFVKKEF